MFAAIAMACSLTACHDDGKGIKPTDENGTVSLSSMAVSVSNVEKVVAASRANVDLSDFNVQIFNAENVKVQEWKYGSMPEVFTLPVGDYHVHVYSHDVLPAEWEHPLFVGDKDFSVTKDNITEIGIVTCTLANIKVSIRYSNELLAKMGDDCKVTVRANDTGELVYTKDERRAGYFAALEGSSTLVAEFTGTIGGNEETVRYTATDLAAGQHRIITFKLRTPGSGDVDENGNIIIGGIGIDYDVTDEDLNVGVKVEEDPLDPSDRPGSDEEPDDSGDDPTPPGPGDEDTIEFTSDDVDFDATNSCDKEAYVVHIISRDGLTHLQVDIASDNENFVASVSSLLPMSFDLAYPGESEAGLASLGFPVGSQVIGATALDFNITQFVPLLKSFPGNHSFTISATDSKGKQLVKTLKFKS